MDMYLVQSKNMNKPRLYIFEGKGKALQYYNSVNELCNSVASDPMDRRFKRVVTHNMEVESREEAILIWKLLES